MPRMLHEYEGEGGSWLPPGWYDVTIKSHQMKDIGDKPAVEFVFVDNQGRQVKGTYYLTEAALWRLGQLAQACGLTEAQRKKYDVDKDSHHKAMVGKKCGVEVITGYNPKYVEVGNCQPFNQAKPVVSSNPQHMPPVHSTAPAQPTDDEVPF